MIKVRYPEMKLLSPYRLSEPLTIASKKVRIDGVNAVFMSIKEWADAKRNYTT